MIARILLTLFAVAVLSFCVFGFAATFEPLSPATQWAWRIVYGSVGAVCLAGLYRIWIPRR